MTSKTMLDCLEHSDRPSASGGGLLSSGDGSRSSIPSGQQPLVIKAFPFTRVRDKLRWKNYAPAELRNSLRAGSLGIPTPEYLGLFRVPAGTG